MLAQPHQPKLHESSNECSYIPQRLLAPLLGELLLYQRGEAGGRLQNRGTQ